MYQLYEEDVPFQHLNEAVPGGTLCRCTVTLLPLGSESHTRVGGGALLVPESDAEPCERDGSEALVVTVTVMLTVWFAARPLAV